MIDTIKIKIVNVKERYAGMIKVINQKNINKEFKIINWRNLNNGAEVDKKQGKVYISSSSRSVNYCFDRIWNVLTFEFSVPKSLYGTNVYQFVNHRCDRNQQFNQTFSASVKWQIENSRDRLVYFIKKFLLDHTLYHVVTENEFLRRKNIDRQEHLINSSCYL